MKKNISISKKEVSTAKKKATPKSPLDKVNKEKVIEAIHHSKGIISNAARCCNVSRTAMYRLIDKYSLRDELSSIREISLDFVESQLFKLIEGIPILDDDGNVIGWQVLPDKTCIIFFLKTIGKNRGYVERSEHINVEKKDFSELPTLEDLENL